MRNKKAQAGIVLIILAISFVGIMTMIIIDETSKVCSNKSYILKGVNGITDQNDGLMSGGDVSRTTLLMESGDIITLNRRINKLKLGNKVVIRICKSDMGSRTYRLIRD